MGKSFLSFILFFLFLGAHGEVFASQELPNFETFAAQLPRYDYDCNVERFFAEPNFVSGFYTEHNLKGTLKVDAIPTNAQFNQKLADKIPHIFYESLKRLSALNPSLAYTVYQNLRREPLRFQCSHLIAKYTGASASIRKRWTWFGEKSINIAAFVAALINEREKDNCVYLNRSLFHEVLHYFMLENEVVDHASDVVADNGRNDVVYSCSNFTWRPLAAPTATTVTRNFKDAAAQLSSYSPVSINETSAVYLNKTASATVDNKNKFNLLLLHVFNYDQCMTCALAKVEKNQMVRSDSTADIASADKFCSVIAPKITIH